MASPPEEINMAKRFVQEHVVLLNDPNTTLLLVAQLFILGSRYEKAAMQELAYWLKSLQL